MDQPPCLGEGADPAPELDLPSKLEQARHFIRQAELAQATCPELSRRRLRAAIRLLELELEG
jgi:hypothetical protein